MLIVEDDQISQKMLQDILKQLGECELASDGKEAISKFDEALKASSPFDMVFLDIMMPEVSGMDALEKIRSLEEENGIMGLDGTKIIMISALSDKEHVLGSFKKGCEAYINKPYNRDEILKKVNDIVAQYQKAD